MEISIGRRPDFVLTRGKEILSYRFEFELHSGDRIIKRKTYVQKSLFMVAKDAQEFVFSAAPNRCPSLWVSEIKSHNIRLESLGQTAMILFKGPNELRHVQRAEIAEKLWDLFVATKGSHST